jgi:hypothetical protein
MFRSESLRLRFALAAILTLAGCSSSSSLAPSSGTAPQGHLQRAVGAAQPANARGVPFVGSQAAWAAFAARPESAARPAAPHAVSPDKKPWVNVVAVSDFGGSGAGAVYLFGSKNNGKLLGTISDVVNPQGLDADASGNLWVASTGNSTIRMYPPKTFTAATILTDPDEFPVSVAVCPNGTVYGSNYQDLSFLPGNIVVYAPGATSPSGTVPDANIFIALFAACDANNVLWFDYMNYDYNPAVASYDGTTVTEYGSLGLTPYTLPGGIRAGNNGTTLAIADQGAALIYLFTKSNLAGGPYKKIKGIFSDPVSFSFPKKQHDVWVADDTLKEGIEATLKSKNVGIIGSGTLLQPIDAFVFPAGNT